MPDDENDGEVLRQPVPAAVTLPPEVGTIVLPLREGAVWRHRRKKRSYRMPVGFVRYVFDTLPRKNVQWKGQNAMRRYSAARPRVRGGTAFFPRMA